MPTTGPGPRQIFVIRHGEKPEDDAGGIGRSGPKGVQEDGAANPHSLTVRGWQRAGALGVLFGSLASVRTGLSRPTAMFAPDYSARPDEARNAVHRTVQTLQPLAALLASPIETPCPREAAGDLVNRHVLTAAEAVVLICWDHRNIPGIVQALAAATSVVPTPVLPAQGWPDDCYDVVLSFTRQAGPPPRYQAEAIPQLLLPGDSPQPLLARARR
jgi:hypothetical protein